jgi:hypothetical protein
VWAALESVGTEIARGQERKQEMWEIGVGVLWGVGNIWKGNLVSLLIGKSSGVEKSLSGAQRKSSPAINSALQLKH